MRIILLLISFVFSEVHMQLVDVHSDDDDFAIDLSAYENRLYGKPDKLSGLNAIEWEKNPTGNPEETGNYLEGDILFPNPTTRNGIIGQSYRWPNKVIPFQINGKFDAQSMDLIEKAINVYHQSTCLRFRPVSSNDRDYISIENSATGCWSSVGRIGGKQTVNLQSPACTTLIGTVLHEFMHAAGFFHEQSRDERDNFVTILFQNVRRGYEDNFKKNPKGTSSGLGIGYDYGSVMHYSADAFSGNGKPTIQTKVKNNINSEIFEMFICFCCCFCFVFITAKGINWSATGIFAKRHSKTQQYVQLPEENEQSKLDNSKYY